MDSKFEVGALLHGPDKVISFNLAGAVGFLLPHAIAIGSPPGAPLA